MSRAAVAPQVQAPQPDISAGPRLGLRPCRPPGLSGRLLLAGFAGLAPDSPVGSRPRAEITRLAAVPSHS